MTGRSLTLGSRPLGSKQVRRCVKVPQIPTAADPRWWSEVVASRLPATTTPRSFARLGGRPAGRLTQRPAGSRTEKAFRHKGGEDLAGELGDNRPGQATQDLKTEERQTKEGLQAVRSGRAPSGHDS